MILIKTEPTYDTVKAQRQQTGMGVWAAVITTIGSLAATLLPALLGGKDSGGAPSSAEIQQLIANQNRLEQLTIAQQKQIKTLQMVGIGTIVLVGGVVAWQMLKRK